MNDSKKRGFKIVREFYSVAVFDDYNVEFGRVGEFAVSFFDDFSGKRRGVNRRVADFSQNVRKRAHVVVMRVGYDKAFNVVLARFQIFNVGNDKIYSRSVFFGELQARVKQDNFVFIFKNGHVATDFFKSSKRHKFDRILVGFF